MKGRSLLRPLALVVLVFGAIWCVMILRWRAINRVPNGVDVALYLVALPLALLLSFVLLRWGIDAIKRRKQKSAAAETTADETETATPDDPSLAWQMSILAADVLFASGDSAAALVEAMRAGQRAELHPTLRDGQDMPIFAAEVADVDIAALDNSLPQAAQGWNDARKRTLTLAHTLAAKMLEEHFDSLQAAVTPAKSAGGRTPPRPALQLEWLLPARWSEAEREIAQTWLATQLAEHDPRLSAPSLQVVVNGVGSGAAVLKRLDDLNRAFNGEQPSLPHLLLASDSHIDAAVVAEWDNARRLHGASRPEGLVPGEGVSAVLLAAAQPKPATELARLHRLLAAQRAKPVDKPGRLQADTLQELIGQALTHAQLEADAPAHVVGDTDMRSSRAAESMHLVEQLLPESDPTETLLPLGVANGECGAALALATVAVAAQLTADTQQPGLVFSNHDASLRAVAVVAPPAAAPAASTTPSLA